MLRTSARLRLIVTVGLLAATCGFGADATASSQAEDEKQGDPSGQVSADPDERPTPNTVSTYTDELHSLIEERQLHGLGYSRVTDTAAERHVDIWWVGDVPASIHQLVKDWPFPVLFHRATHTLAEVEAAQEQLARVVSLFPFPVRGFYIAVDGGGAIVLQVPSANVEQAENFVESPSKLLAVGFNSQVPLRVESDDSGPVSPTGRAHDTAPFYGGSYIDIDGDGDSNPDCTSGFAVHQPNSNYTGLLTARHCGLSKCWTTLADLRVGCTGNGIKAIDSIIMSGKTYASRVFNDQDPFPVNLNGASFSIPVVGARNPDQGERICLSGAFSGEECSGAYVWKTGVYWYMKDYGLFEFGPGFKVQNDLSGRVHGFAGPGDSGGPVYAKTTTPTGVNQARARGLIIAEDQDQLMCPGYEEGDVDRRCSWGIYVMNIAAIENQQDVKVTETS